MLRLVNGVFNVILSSMSQRNESIRLFRTVSIILITEHLTFSKVKKWEMSTNEDENKWIK